MSQKAKRARRLAVALSRESGTDVIVRYDRTRLGYRVEWFGGPDIEGMRAIADRIAPDFADIDLGAMSWRRRTAIYREEVIYHD